MPSSLHCDCALEIVPENKDPRVAVCLELSPHPQRKHARRFYYVVEDDRSCVFSQPFFLSVAFVEALAIIQLLFNVLKYFSK